jgi:two-component system response regulator PilR (NtrC family)
MSAVEKHHVLVVDDEPDLRTLYELTLLREGYHIDTASTVGDALSCLQERSYSAVITDMRLPDGTGLDVLHWLDHAKRSERAIVITAYGSATNAVEALKAGAYDYLSKPVDLKQFRAIVASALGRGGANAQERSAGGAGAEDPSMSARAASAAPGAGKPRPSAIVSVPKGMAPHQRVSGLSRMIGESNGIRQVRHLIEKVSRSMAPVLIHGESGTGKELVARAIHDSSARQGSPFLAVNCGAIPEHLLEAEFFGYRRGAFTGAHEDRNGFFRAAEGGTLFLDEIGDLPVAMQSKLLRVIQERAVRPLGATAEIAMDVRLLSATHKDLAKEVQAGRFRQDLYYRLNVIQIPLPALRERREDLPLIAQSMLSRLAAEAGAERPLRLGRAALAAMACHPFEGNVRELENLLHRAVALCAEDEISPHDLGLAEAPEPVASLSDPCELASRPLASSAHGSEMPAMHGQRLPNSSTSLPVLLAAADLGAELPSDLASYLDSVERVILMKALDKHRNNRTAAGAAMGLSLRQMRYRMARLGIQLGGDGELG